MKNYPSIKQYALLCICVLLVKVNLSGAVWVYPSPHDTLQSNLYKVTIHQDGKSYPSFVYQDKNTFEKQLAKMTDLNHWTTFSFNGPIEVSIEMLKGIATKCHIHPYSKGIVHNLSDSVITFRLETPAKLFIRIDGLYEDPLFIFADAPETNIPDRNDPDVVFFEGGKIHPIGEHYPIEDGKTYYIEGGAYVLGSMLAEKHVSATIKGRGIISNSGSPDRHHREHGFDGVSVHFPGYNTEQLVEGITFTNPSMYCLLSRGKLTCQNVKMFGWQFETDGVGGGNGSLIEDCFFKVNDDVVKLYSTNTTVKDLVIYQQINGAPFQLSWGSGKGHKVMVDGIDIVQSDVLNDNEMTGNRAVINLRMNNQKHISHLNFSNIRADQDVARLLGLYNGTGGQVSDIEISNVTIRGTERMPSYLNAPIGTISKITLRNVVINGTPFTVEKIKQEGNVTHLKTEP